MYLTFALTLVFALGQPSQAAAAEDPTSQPVGDSYGTWNRVLVARTNEIDVTILCKPEVSIADEEWLVVEFHNKTEEHIQYLYANVWISRFGEAGVSMGTLVQEDLARHIGNEGLAPGVSTYPCWMSTKATTSLAAPWQKSETIRCEVRASISYHSRKEGQMPCVPPPLLSFAWRALEKEQWQQVVRERLMKLLQEPDPRGQHSTLLGVFLHHDQLTPALPVSELIQALEFFSGPYDGLGSVADALVRNFGSSPELAHWVIENFDLKNPRISSLLKHGYWHPSVLEELTIEALSKADGNSSRAVHFLHENRDRWMPDDARSTQLFQAVLELYPDLLGSSLLISKPELNQWLSHVRTLSHTGAEEAIEILRPALNDTRQLWTTAQMHLFPGYLVTLRPCDTACLGILTLLDGDETKALRLALGLEGTKAQLRFTPYPHDDAGVLKMWDDAIKAVRARLGE